MTDRCYFGVFGKIHLGLQKKTVNRRIKNRVLPVLEVLKVLHILKIDTITYTGFLTKMAKNDEKWQKSWKFIKNGVSVYRGKKWEMQKWEIRTSWNEYLNMGSQKMTKMTKNGKNDENCQKMTSWKSRVPTRTLKKWQNGQIHVLEGMTPIK